MDNKITLSPSRVKRWVRCKRSYYWRYYQKLVRVQKDTPMSLGLVVGEALTGYYSMSPSPHSRSQELMNKELQLSLETNQLKFLNTELKEETKKEWEKIVNVSRKLLSTYHDWASPKDTFHIIYVEHPQEILLTPQIHLLAIPDAVVAVDPETNMVFEHKVRYRYHSGDFGIDYQSVGSCLVSNSIGTLYNILEYGKTHFHREPIMRSEHELNYFRDIYIRIGEDILSTPADRLYPMPFKRCSCEYWELCNAEQSGLDVDSIISELYLKSVHKSEKPKEETDGGEGE